MVNTTDKGRHEPKKDESIGRRGMGNEGGGQSQQQGPHETEYLKHSDRMVRQEQRQDQQPKTPHQR